MTAPNSRRHRQALIQTAIRLFRRQGYAATGLAEILKFSKAPKGSLYYYFPGGKEALGAAAVTAASDTVVATLEELEASTGSAEAFLSRYAAMLANWTKASGFADGCPISTTLLEMTPQSKSITAAGQAAFSAWKQVIVRVFRRDGMPEKEAETRATLVMATLQGALLLSRVEQSTAPFEQISQLARI